MGINESAYKALVNEQSYCSWCCDTCINTKQILTIMPKTDNNNKVTNQPITNLMNDSIKAEPESKPKKKKRTPKAPKNKAGK